MQPDELVKQLGKIFNESEIVPVLIGGWAINFLGITRQTLDLDFMIVENDFAKLKSIFIENGFKLLFKNDLFAKFSHPHWRYFEIDILLAEEQTVKKIKAAGKTMKTHKLAFILPSAEHIIAMKIHSLNYNFDSRFPKDFPDIINLIKINKIDTKTNNFKELCLKFGNADLLSMIQKHT